MTEPLWIPSAERIENANITIFSRQAEARHGLKFKNYAELHRWSVEHREAFWDELWNFCGVIASERGGTVLENGDQMPGARWYPQARLNFAENLLRRRDSEAALIFHGEDRVRRELSFSGLYAQVSQLAQFLAAAGIEPGDRVAGYLPNMPETIVAMLATVSLGATWSSCSPDFGVRGVVDRFGQIKPKVLLSADGYYYNGKTHDCLAKVNEVLAAIPEIERLLVVPYVSEDPDLSVIEKSAKRQIERFDQCLEAYPERDIEFVQLPFDHPLYIMYSSGTTGAPKCIVHGAGGSLLKHLSEHRLHSDLKRGDRLFYFTTCGWMMWNWLASGLASEATLVLYDGAPSYPDARRLWDLADAEQVNIFGTSAKFIDVVKKSGLRPIVSHDLSSIRAILSTGSPLVPESFDFVYQDIKHDVCLSSVTGGTDLLGCFGIGNPALPVYRGEIQCNALGMQVEAYNDQGRPVIGEQGELVCSRAFPSMPVGFFNDPDGSRYHSAYFETYPNVWCHGDWIVITEHGGMIMYGRSDTTLNPGGVRIGTAEIYRQVEQLDEVLEGLVIGQQWEGDVRVVLFVVLREGLELDEELTTKIKKQIRANTTPRHVPARVLQVPDLPRTKSGKITELAVRDVVHGRRIKNQEALANPQALEYFRDRVELQE